MVAAWYVHLAFCLIVIIIEPVYYGTRNLAGIFVENYPYFGGMHCLNLLPYRAKQIPLTWQYPSTKLHNTTSKKTIILVFRNIFSCCIKQALLAYPICHPNNLSI
jgi:hypothetical protein